METKNSMLLTDDDRTNFMCGIKEIKIPEFVPLSKVDYNLCEEKTEEMDDKKKLSYLSVRNVEEGEVWYRQNFPKIPEDFYPLMAKWNWGDLNYETKKSVKNQLKKEKKKQEKNKNKIEIIQKPCVVTFE